MTLADFWNWIMGLFARAKTTAPQAKPAPPPAPPPPAPAGPMPWGPSGGWQLVFEDQFDGTDLDLTKWCKNTWGGAKVNNVNTSADNVAVKDGLLTLTLSDAATGASINTNPHDHWEGPNIRGDVVKVGFEAPVGSVCEARVCLPGTSSNLSAWAAWWTSGENWPRNGEHDIVEVLGDPGQATVNYHSHTGAHNQGAVAGDWSGWHTYTLHRQSKQADVWWNGQLIKSYPTDDSGGPHSLILTVGEGVPGSQMQVDYVRVWEPV